MNSQTVSKHCSTYYTERQLLFECVKLFHRLTGIYLGGSLAARALTLSLSSLNLISWLYSALADSTADMAGIVGFTEKLKPYGLYRSKS